MATATATAKKDVKEFVFSWTGTDKAGKTVRGEMKAGGEAVEATELEAGASTTDVDVFEMFITPTPPISSPTRWRCSSAASTSAAPVVCRFTRIAVGNWIAFVFAVARKVSPPTVSKVVSLARKRSAVRAAAA